LQSTIQRKLQRKIGLTKFRNSYSIHPSVLFGTPSLCKCLSSLVVILLLNPSRIFNFDNSNKHLLSDKALTKDVSYKLNNAPLNYLSAKKRGQQKLKQQKSI